MFTSDEQTSLINLGGGAAVEQFNFELERVLENLADINKPGKEERTITLTVKLKPTDTPGIISTKIACKSKLAGQLEFCTHLMVGQDRGKMEARELFKQRPLQFKEPDGKIIPIERED